MAASKELEQFNTLSQWNLRDEQQQAVSALLYGIDVLATLPTGFGKSRIFHAFTSVKDKELSGAVVVLVVTPLISITKDQLDYLKTIGFSAANLSDLAIEELKECKIKFLFGSAEDAATEEFRKELKDTSSKLHKQLACIVIDESHTIETWTSKRYKYILYK